MSNAYTDNGKKLRNFFIWEFPIESIGKCGSAGICYNIIGISTTALEIAIAAVTIPIMIIANTHTTAFTNTLNRKFPHKKVTKFFPVFITGI